MDQNWGNVLKSIVTFYMKKGIGRKEPKKSKRGIKEPKENILKFVV